MEDTQQPSVAPLGASATQPNTAQQPEDRVHPTPPPACPEPQEQPEQSSSDTDDTEDQAHADDVAAARAAGIAQKAALDRLGAAIARVEDPFFCNNEVALPGPIEILLKPKPHLRWPASASPHLSLKVPASFIYVPPPDNPRSHYSRMCDGFLFESRQATAKLRGSRLTSECDNALRYAFEASPFGRGNTTVVDESIRKAMQVGGAATIVV